MAAFKKILIANRGEIACRILRTLNKMKIANVVVHHPIDAETPAVKMAAETVAIDGPTPVAAYLDEKQILAACKKTGADALHPGYGFLAENANFAKLLAEAGITFIGPSPKTIELMGNKIAARTFCVEHGFPLAPSVAGTDGGDAFIESARQIGTPLLIKAAAGGGGKGLHIVHDLDHLEQAVQLARGEARRSFGNDTVYAERYLEQPRHIEVQVLADHHGRVVHLGERECSIQRRFQKIIEESPAPSLTSELRERICTTAVEIARRAGYCNAGTVEFLLAPDGEFYFLEMNTRIQVEHPVTELVTGIDLVELQIKIAGGECLPFDQTEIRSTGHAIELRLYAEDPDNEFIPATGRLLAYRLPQGKGVRADDGFKEGMQVTSVFDPMLAKLIFHGRQRTEAVERAQQALAAAVVLGVRTNLDYLGRIISHPAFQSGRINTGFIPQYEAELKPPPLSAEQQNLLLTAAALSNRDLTDPAFSLPEPYRSIGNWRN